MIDWPFLHSLAGNETFSTKEMDDLRAKLQTEIDALNAEHQRIQVKVDAYRAIDPTRRNESHHADYRQAQADRVKALQWEVTLRREGFAEYAELVRVEAAERQEVLVNRKADKVQELREENESSEFPRRESSTILEHPDYLAIVADERALSQAYATDNGENWAATETAEREFKELQQFLGL